MQQSEKGSLALGSDEPDFWFEFCGCIIVGFLLLSQKIGRGWSRPKMPSILRLFWISSRGEALIDRLTISSRSR